VHAADIASEVELQAVFDALKPQIIIHAASSRPTDKAAALARTNIEGTEVLLNARGHAARREPSYTRRPIRPSSPRKSR
jgi:dTDP-D-glucose 4,6-dehydratase